MAAETIEALQADLQRNVGRNLLRYQAIEQMMKFLLINARVTVTAKGPAPEFQRRQRTIERRTMGQLRDQYFREVLTDPNETHNDPDPTKLPRFTTSFRLDLGQDGDALTDQQNAFASMLEDRNDLVHHFLAKCPLNTAEHLRDAIAFLERQREKVIPLHDHLKSMVDALIAGRKQLADFLTSEEGIRHFELRVLQHSRLVAVLVHAAQTMGDSNGWLSLSAVGHLIRREASDDFDAMRSRYGCRTLKQLIVAAELFDISDEVLPNGGIRTRYRISAQTVEPEAPQQSSDL